MKYDFTKCAKTLELDKILERLANETSIADSAQMAINLQPDNNCDNVLEKLKNTEDAYLFMAKYAAPSFGAAENVSYCIKQASVGGVLSIRELLKVAETLRIIRSVKQWRSNCDGLKGTSLEALFDSLVPNKYLEEKINFAIKSEDDLNDNASSLLYDLRRKIVSKQNKIRDILEKIVHGPTAKYLQDNIITQRDGRSVVPVKTEFRSEVSGIVHDTSSTGSTVFIEPMSVVETNNEIRVMIQREQEEIERILAELSAEVANFGDSISSSFTALAELNFIFAKARLAYKMRAAVPNVNQNGYIYLKNARHPLINQKSVVPITVSLGGDYDTLVITGPNTGGKTVTLKTVGLLTLMTMCGLMLPVDDGSSISVYNKVFADIGDEQSIEQSLSTFSSHMVNIISILDSADSRSLVLFDELCAGTDPIEGAALAKSILMRLSAVGASTVATTHYPELKAYAIDSDRVENACCEFDLATLKPTYKLIIGMPGRSNAFAISKRLGLDDDIINNAKEQIADDDMRFERVVSALERARKSADDEHKKVSELRAQLAEAKRVSDRQMQEISVNRDKIIEQARENAARLVDAARYKSGLLLNQLEDMKKEMTVANASLTLEKARREYKKSLETLEREANPVVSKIPIGDKLTDLPKKGDIVVISDIGRDATVIDVKPNTKKVYVMSGSIKMWVDLDNIVKKSNPKTSSESQKKYRNVSTPSKKDKNVSGEIDLRGMASDEALLELDKYLDDAVISGISTVTIIHGKGTGVLRKAVQSHLRKHKSVKSFRIGLFGEGENGVTIAELGN